jgi:hypothetical protein
VQKVAVFVEGQSELIFVRNLLYHLIESAKFSFECFKLHANSQQEVPYEYKNPHAEVHFQIINVGNDEKVLDAIKERKDRLLSKGITKIIGLRDMYSKAYRIKSKNIIDDDVTQQFIEAVTTAIAEMNNADKISFHFAIMELEAWWLSMYNLFSKINELLTVIFIEEKLGYNLSKIDPEKAFFHPAHELDKILKLVGVSYKKHFDDVESITSKMDYSDISDALNNNRCDCFRKFCDEIHSFTTH